MQELAITRYCFQAQALRYHGHQVGVHTDFKNESLTTVFVETAVVPPKPRLPLKPRPPAPFHAAHLQSSAPGSPSDPFRTPSIHPAHLLYHILNGDDAHWLLLVSCCRLTGKAGLEGGERGGAGRA